MTDISIMKSADSETIKQRVKAIYPHIVVSGDIDKPYYSIHWYDIEKEEMYCGFSSYKLELVRKWLEEEFEVVEADIDNLINRLKANAEGLTNAVKYLNEQVSSAKAEAIKEFAERLEKEAENVGIDREGDFLYSDSDNTAFEIYNTVAEWCKEVAKNILKEMVGDTE